MVVCEVMALRLEECRRSGHGISLTKRPISATRLSTGRAAIDFSINQGPDTPGDQTQPTVCQKVLA